MRSIRFARAAAAVSAVVVSTAGLGAASGLSGSAPASATVAPTGAVFVPMDPVRIFDTRTGLGGTVGPVAGGGTFSVVVAGSTDGQITVPNEAVAAVLNVTYVDAKGPGFVTVFPAGTSRPNASNLNKVGKIGRAHV